MKILTACLVCLIAGAAVPAHAQDLEARVTALESQVAKLTGSITMNDLVGTYTVTSFSTEMSAPLSGSSGSVGLGVTVGTAMLLADGTGSFTTTDTGNTLGGALPWLLTTDDPRTKTGTFNWAYASGILTTDTGLTFSVAVGGRLLIMANSFNPQSDQFSVGDAELVILTRLQ